MRYLLTILLFLPCVLFAQLPTVDEVQDSDGAFTPSRGIPSLLRMDTTRKYMAPRYLGDIALLPGTDFLPDSLRGNFFRGSDERFYFIAYDRTFIDITPDKVSEEKRQINASAGILAFKSGVDTFPKINVWAFGDSKLNRVHTPSRIQANYGEIYGFAGPGYMSFSTANNGRLGLIPRSTGSSTALDYPTDDLAKYSLDGQAQQLTSTGEVRIEPNSNYTTYTSDSTCQFWDYALISYLQHPSGGSIGVYVDDVLIQTLPTTGVEEKLVYEITGLQDTAHTIEIRNVSGTNYILDGYFLRSNKTGVVFNVAANSGFEAENFVDLWQEVDNRQMLDSLPPDAIMVRLGTNESNRDTMPSTFGENVTILVDTALTYNSIADVTLIGIEGMELSATYTDAAYNQQLSDTATARYWNYASLSSIIPSITDFQRKGLSDDGIHENAKGSHVVGNYLFDALNNVRSGGAGTDADSDPSNELQDLGISGGSLTISGGADVPIVDITGDTTLIANTVTTSVRTYPDRVEEKINNAPYSVRTVAGGRPIIELYSQINSIDATNTGQAWVSGGTTSTSTRTFGDLSPDGQSGNHIFGNSDLRTIFNGYDNGIGVSLASSILTSHHSYIGTGGGGHNVIVGGSNHWIDGGGYVGIFAGTNNTFRTGGFAFSGGSRSDSLSGEFVASIASDDVRIEGDEFNIIMTSNQSRIHDGGLYNTMFSSFLGEVQGNYNIVAGLRGKAFGRGNAVFGGRNEVGVLNGTERNYNIVSGTFNLLTGEHSAVIGETNTQSGGHSIVVGQDNTSTGSFSFTAGELNQMLNSYSATWGRNNVINSSYSWAGGRNNTISSSTNYSSIISGVNMTNSRSSTALADNIEVEGFYYDRRGEAGNNNDVLTKDAAGTDWKAPGTLVVTNPTGGTNTLQDALDDLNSGVSSLWTENGSDIYYNSGNVGIGTSTPGSNLHVVDPTGNVEMHLEADDFATFRITADNAGLGSTDPSFRFNIGATEYWRVGMDNSSAQKPFLISPSTLSVSNSSIAIREDVNRIGLGGVLPQRTLHVNGDMRLGTLLTGMPTTLLAYGPSGDIVDGTSLLESTIDGRLDGNGILEDAGPHNLNDGTIVRGATETGGSVGRWQMANGESAGGTGFNYLRMYGNNSKGLNLQMQVNESTGAVTDASLTLSNDIDALDLDATGKIYYDAGGLDRGFDLPNNQVRHENGNWNLPAGRPDDDRSYMTLNANGTFTYVPEFVGLTTSDQTLTAGGSLASDSEITVTGIPAGTYEAEVILNYESSNINGELIWTFTTVGVDAARSTYRLPGQTNNVSSDWTVTSNTAEITTTNQIHSTGAQMGTIVFTSTGSVTLRRRAGSTGDITLREGSRIILKKID